MNREYFLNKMLPFLLLALILAWNSFLVLPGIGAHIEDPNLIPYFNQDEGFLMDISWYYYCGEKRPSFQYWNDYGLELMYFADLCRGVLSRFIEITPGLIVLIMRWVNFIFWLGALAMLFFLTNRHFGNNKWKSLIVVSLLATNPALHYFSSSLKPEPIVLFFLFTGLYFLLSAVDSDRKTRFIFLTMLCASTAFIIKYAGIFLVPPIALSMYFYDRFGRGESRFRNKSLLSLSWAFPAFCGAVLIAAVLAVVFLYVRNTTSATWISEFGFWGTVARKKSIGALLILGAILIFSSGVLFSLKRTGKEVFNRIAAAADEVNYYIMIALAIFTLFTLAIGLKWVIHPNLLISMLGQFGAQSSINLGSVIQDKGYLLAYAGIVADKILNFNPVIFLLLILYFIAEWQHRQWSFENQRPTFFKRLVLAVFVISFFPYMFSFSRSAQHHMLPFFAVGAILSLQGIEIITGFSARRTAGRRLIKSAAYILIVLSIFYNANIMIKVFECRNSRQKDVVFDIVRWWRAKVSPGARILADHPVRVYLPPEYKNVRYLSFSPAPGKKIDEIKDSINSFRPLFVYYAVYSDDATQDFRLNSIMAGAKTELVGVFSNAYSKYEGDRIATYFIYKITYR